MDERKGLRLILRVIIVCFGVWLIIDTVGYMKRFMYDIGNAPLVFLGLAVTGLGSFFPRLKADDK